jgi:polyhydroxyalkanoate synthesis repressor PhaR
VVRRVRALTDRPIVAVGGIQTAEHAREALAAGATLVQLYTGFVYGGPAPPGASPETWAPLVGRPVDNRPRPSHCSQALAANQEGCVSQGRLIKRYANRKLYDTANSRYVTLEEVAALLQAGEDVRIVDNQSKADITAVTLAQILVEEEKRGRQPRAQGGLRQLLQRRIAEPVLQIRSTVEESVSRLLKSDPASPKAEVRTEARSEPPKPEQKPEGWQARRGAPHPARRAAAPLRRGPQAPGAWPRWGRAHGGKE